MKDHLTTKGGGKETGEKVDVKKNWPSPDEKTHDIPSSISEVKRLADLPLHDKHTNIIGKELRQKD